MQIMSIPMCINLCATYKNPLIKELKKYVDNL